MCGDQAILPTTHVLSRGLIKRGKVSATIHETDNCRQAQYKRRPVRVRSLQMAGKTLIKVPSYYPCVTGQALTSVKKFCHEAALWKRLDHPNVAAVLGVTMDPYQVVFDRVSDKDIVQYTSGERVDRETLVSSALGHSSRWLTHYLRFQIYLRVLDIYTLITSSTGDFEG
jgi:hypothetical protein